MSNKIFISYSSVDKMRAKQLAKALEELSIKYFLDQKDVDWGDDVTARLKLGLEECSALIVIISPASLKSQWVPFEIGHASACGIKILPFLTHPSLDLPGFLQGSHYKTKLSDVKKYLRNLGWATPPRIKMTPDETPIYFGDGWEGFSTDSEEDILFCLQLGTNTDLLEYVVIQKELKPEVFTSRVKGLLAVPDMSPDPYQDGTGLSMLVFSDPSGGQSSDDYDWFFDHYAPIFPDDVSVDLCDGCSQAMWLWSCSVPEHWALESPPFLKSEFRPDLARLLDSWLSAHNRAIASIPPNPKAQQNASLNADKPRE